MLLATVALLSTASVTAQTQGPAAGLAVGSRAPAFEATDQSGKPRNFEDLAGKHGLLLLFFRSADW